MNDAGAPPPPRAIPIVVIAGSTASGKTAAAIEACERVGGEVISCDSVAVYREFDIGAAKPSPEDRARVPHHLIDVAAPDEAFTAARFVALADAAIAECAARGRPVLVAGGSGLYLRALLRGLFDAPPPNVAIRAQIKFEAAAHGWPALHARLAAVDAEAAARIHENDPVRIARALEVWEQTGVPLSRHHARHAAEAAAAAARYRTRTWLIEPPAAVLDARIAARTERMLAAGLVEETRGIVARWGRSPKALGALGYKEALAQLDGKLDAAALGETIRIATRHYGRRQRTWFRSEPGAMRIASARDLPLDEIRAFFDEASR